MHVKQWLQASASLLLLPALVLAAYAQDPAAARQAGMGRGIAAFQSRLDKAVGLTAEQQETVRTFRAQVLTLRAQLREVQHALQQDIDRLQTWVMLANIAAVPALVALLALIVALWRRARRHRTRAAAAA